MSIANARANRCRRTTAGASPRSRAGRDAMERDARPHRRWPAAPTAERRPSTRRCTTRCSSRTCSATTTASTRASTTRSTRRADTRSTRTSRVGTSTDRKCNCSAMSAAPRPSDMMRSLLADTSRAVPAEMAVHRVRDTTRSTATPPTPILAEAYAFGRPRLRRARGVAGDGARAPTERHRSRLGRRTSGQRRVPAPGLDPGRPARQDVVRLHDRWLGDARVRHRRLRDRGARRARSATARPRRRSRRGPATGATCSTRRRS